MRERLPVWGARGLLLSPLCIGLYILLQIPVKHSHHFWPFGHVHSVGQAVTVVFIQAIGAFVAITAGATVVLLMFLEVKLTSKIIWKTAWRQPHIPWKKRWEPWDGDCLEFDEKHYHGPMVTYDKPKPLIRGRIGSK